MDEGSLFSPADESQAIQTDFGRIVEQLTPLLGRLEGEPRPLDGGITNRNYRATFGDREYVVRIPGKDTSRLGIDRGAERAANELAAEIGIAPRVAAFLTEPACIVTEFVEGSAMTEDELAGPEALHPIAVALSGFHDCGREIESHFDPVAVVDEYATTATERGASLPRHFGELRERAVAIGASVSGPEHDAVPCHNDLLAANFLRAENGVVIVDWEYAGMGDRFFDLANFAINNGLDAAAQSSLIDAYFEASPVSPPRSSADRLADLRSFMFLSDFREAMWGLVQGTLSDLDFDFEAYAAKHFKRMTGPGASDAAS